MNTSAVGKCQLSDRWIGKYVLVFYGKKILSKCKTSKHKMSQMTKCHKWQNVTNDKMSQMTKCQHYLLMDTNQY
jgi:hypothetical protein